MESLELANQIVEILVDKQGEDILVLDLQEVTTFTDYFVICSGTSQRQLLALKGAITEALKQGDERVLPYHIEGESDGGWVLLDYNSVIVHLFSPEKRDYYDLEGFWQNARVVVRIQ
ncbi:MAG TPA: ribosome silencing factor [Anaerolineae bacterium]|nr:ribosome silencing factor [Anaerolineae bacterium]